MGRVWSVNSADGSAVLRIGELSRRLGVSDHVLRAWESRYGLLRPTRSSGGFRLYSEADEHRVSRMKTLLANGVSAAEAARVVLGEERVVSTDSPAPYVEHQLDSGPPEGFGGLRNALDALDETAAQAVLDRLLSDLSMPTVLRDVVVPYLSQLGQRWQQGTVSVAQEHFASNIIRGRLAGLARGWGSGHGRNTVLACPPGEQHDMALMVFGVVLSRNGWRVSYLGVETPMADLIQTVQQIAPDLVVLAATVPQRFDEIVSPLLELASLAPLAIAGAGATQAAADQAGARLLSGDPVTEAQGMSWPT